PLRRVTPPIASPSGPWHVTHFAVYTVAPYAISALAYESSCGGTELCADATVKPIVKNTVPRMTAAWALDIGRLSLRVRSHRCRIGVGISGGPKPTRRTTARGRG